MSERYDDEALKFIETRKRVAQMRRAEAIKKRNMTVAAIVGVVLVVILFSVIAVSCGNGNSSTVETTTAKATTKKAETTTVEETTEEESTTSEEDGELMPGKTMYINDDGINLRKEANTTSGIIDQLLKDTEVTVVGVEGDWVKVSRGNDVGYVKKEFLDGSKNTGNSSEDEDNPEESTTVATTE